MLLQPSTRDTRREKALARIAVAVLVSALANGIVLSLLEQAGAFAPPSTREATPVALAAVSKARWEANREIVARDGVLAEAASPARRPDPRSVLTPSLGIVDVAPSPDPRRPERARFLADRDNTVPRDTQFEGKTSTRGETVLARPSAGAPGAQGIPQPGEDGEDDHSAPGRSGAASAEDRVAAARLALAPGGDLASARPGHENGGEGGALSAGKFDPRLLPLGERYEGPGGGAPADEKLPGVAPGEATMLNTFAFKYADFFRRVHDAIKASWDPNRAWNARDPHDEILGRGTRLVLVDIVLDPRGGLKEVRVVRGSGLDFFDRECVRAVEDAAPFPNPPRALVNGDGLVVLRRYGLVFNWPESLALDRLLRRRPD